MFQENSGSEPDWAVISREWEGSGQNQRDFCNQRGYSYNVFKVARSKLGHCLSRSARKLKRYKRPVESEVGVGFLPVSMELTRTQGEQENLIRRPYGEVALEVELPLGVVLRFWGTGAQK